MAEKNFAFLKRENHEPSREYAIRCLDYNISNLLLEPGQLVSEKQIADLTGLSVTPVREAFFSLSQIGIIEIYPQKGSAIALIDPALVEESRFTRWAVERCVVEVVCRQHAESDVQVLQLNLAQQKIAAQNHDLRTMLDLDNSFHQQLFRIAHRELTYSYISRLRVHFDRVRMLDLMATNAERNIMEHGRLLGAIEDNNGTEAVSIMDKHLNHVTYDMAELKEKYPLYFK